MGCFVEDGSNGDLVFVMTMMVASSHLEMMWLVGGGGGGRE